MGTTKTLRHRAALIKQLSPSHIARMSQVEQIAAPLNEGISLLSPEIRQKDDDARNHFLALGAPDVYCHSKQALLAAVCGKLLPLSGSGADQFSQYLSELILYHSIDSEAYLPNSGLSADFERRFALHKKFKQLDSSEGDRSAEYVRLLNDPSIDATDLLLVLSARIADMMTVHDPATLKASATKMRGVFPVHESWEQVKASWAQPMLRIYCPMADWGGQTLAYRSMRDNAIRYLYPEEYADMLGRMGRWVDALANTTRILTGLLHQMSETLGVKVLVVENYQNVSAVFPLLDKDTVIVALKPFKGLGGLLAKSLKRGIPIEKVHDWAGATIITDSTERMYEAVSFLYEKGIRSAARQCGVKDLLTLLPVDYAMSPKPVTLYQSVHLDTVSSDPNMVPLEIIVRTRDMHIRADEGTAGHDVYKLSPLVNGERKLFTQRRDEVIYSMAA